MAVPLSVGRARSRSRSIGRLNYFTAYEYLEARFDVRVRTLAADDLHPLAARLDGDGDVRAVPRDQRRVRRPIPVDD